MDKEKAKAAFENYWSSIENKQTQSHEETYLAGAEWAWGEQQKRVDDLYKAGNEVIDTNLKLQAELSQVKKAKDEVSAENKKLRSEIENLKKALKCQDRNVDKLLKQLSSK